MNAHLLCSAQLLTSLNSVGNITKWRIIKGIQLSGTEQTSALHFVWSNLDYTSFEQYTILFCTFV